MEDKFLKLLSATILDLLHSYKHQIHHSLVVCAFKGCKYLSFINNFVEYFCKIRFGWGFINLFYINHALDKHSDTRSQWILQDTGTYLCLNICFIAVLKSQKERTKQRKQTGERENLLYISWLVKRALSKASMKKSKVYTTWIIMKPIKIQQLLEDIQETW